MKIVVDNANCIGYNQDSTNGKSREFRKGGNAMGKGKQLKHNPYYAIRSYVILARMTEQEVAEMLGMTYRTFYSKVNGMGDFTLGEAIKLSQILGRTMDEIFLT